MAGVINTGMEKFTIFAVGDGEIGLWTSNSKSKVADRSVSVPMTLTDIEKARTWEVKFLHRTVTVPTTFLMRRLQVDRRRIT